MAPKQRSAAARGVSPAPSSLSSATAAAPTPTTTTTASSSAAATTTQPPAGAAGTTTRPTALKTGPAAGGVQSWDKVVGNVAAHYVETTPQRTKLLDAFMAFLVAVGALQFAYCVLAGNYPFNAFLSGFAATVGQFVLTASLRIQTTEGNKGEFPAVSQERAFADYVVCSLILHFFCVNFIN
ncbi:hypothetical protein VTK26DRAFT_2804 [Humicola hyalothermophila]